MKVTYSTNNSGGGWWLKDKDWEALEKAGWEVEWKKERFLGALATEASKDFTSLKECIEEFEKVTKQDATVDGCNCCGAPHSFSWGRNYSSGQDLLEHLYSKSPTRREALELLNRRSK